MSDFRRLFPFIRPYLGKLVLSLVLLVLAGTSEVLTTSLAIPLFDDVLVLGKEAPGAATSKVSFLYRYLSALPGNRLTQLAFALLFLIGWVFYVDWKLAALSMLIAPVALALTLTMGRSVRRASRKSRESIGSLSDTVQQTITGIRIVKAFGMEEHEQSRFREATKKLFQINLKSARVMFMNSPLMEFVRGVRFVTLIYFVYSVTIL